MSVSTVRVLQIAHRDKKCIEKFLKAFKARKQFRGACREYFLLDGCDSKIIKRRRIWHTTTVVFYAVNWDDHALLKLFDESYIIQVGPVDDREVFSTADYGEDEEDILKRLGAFEFPFS